MFKLQSLLKTSRENKLNTLVDIILEVAKYDTDAAIYLMSSREGPEKFTNVQDRVAVTEAIQAEYKDTPDNEMNRIIGAIFLSIFLFGPKCIPVDIAN